MSLRSLLFSLAAILVAAPAFGQNYEILVTTGNNGGLQAPQFEDLVEESAWLVQDFGGFTISRWYELDASVGPETADAVIACGNSASCYIDNLFDSNFDYVLAVSAYDEGTEVVVEYQMIDTRIGIQAAQTTAHLPTVTDFAYLLVPCHDALKVTPDWIDPGPVATVPETPQPMWLPPEEPDRELGRLGRIGAYTAAGGGAFVVGGILLGFGADETQQEIQAEPHPRDELRSLQSKGQRQQRMANAFFAVGGAALAGGVTLLVLDRVRDDDDGFALGTDGRSVWVRAEF